MDAQRSDGRDGCDMVFDTEEHASAAMEAMQPPPGGPTVINCAVFEFDTGRLTQGPNGFRSSVVLARHHRGAAASRHK